MRSLKRFGGPIAKVVSSFSLLALSLAWAADYGVMSARLGKAANENQKAEVLRELAADPSIDEPLRSRLREYLADRSFGPSVGQVERMVELRAMTQGSRGAAAPANAQAAARKITESPLYRDPGEQEQSNWFSKGFERVGEWLKDLLSRQQPQNLDAPRLEVGGFLGFLRILLWLVLGGLVLLFLYFAVRHFRWKAGLERKAKALFAEDEPVLSRDEYLEEAERLAAAGKYREAVRCLYLACLLLFDERDVARFLKGQTNWEHLRRIQASPNRPEGLDFEPATQKFDVVWYGMQVQGASDLDQMRGWYAEIGERLRRKAA